MITIVKEDETLLKKFRIFDYSQVVLFFLAGYFVWEFTIARSFHWFVSGETMLEGERFSVTLINGLLVLASIIIPKLLVKRAKVWMWEYGVKKYNHIYGCRWDYENLLGPNLFWFVGFLVGGITSFPTFTESAWHFVVVVAGVMVPIGIVINVSFILVIVYIFIQVVLIIYWLAIGTYRYITKSVALKKAIHKFRWFLLVVIVSGVGLLLKDITPFVVTTDGGFFFRMQYAGEAVIFIWFNSIAVFTGFVIMLIVFIIIRLAFKKQKEKDPTISALIPEKVRISLCQPSEGKTVI